MSSHKPDFKLEQLFKRCDTRGDGFIGQKEFRDLCRDFGIENGDADNIFYDLDHDGDGTISFDDFAFGFRDFVTPGARRGSIQLELARQPSIRCNTHPKLVEEGGGGAKGDEGAFVVEELDAGQRRRKQFEMEKKHGEAKEAWKHFADNLGNADVKKFLNVSSDKVVSLYEDLRTSDAPPHLVSQFEEVLSSLVADVKNMENETKKMEERMAKERESHTQHLKSIEAELDAQVARVENVARERAKADYEEEKRMLQDKMECEMAKMDAELKIFKTFDGLLNKEKDEATTKETQKRLEKAVGENRGLKSSLNETNTNIHLLQSEMNQMKSQYEAKCSELHEERENRVEFAYEYDNLSRQLDLLRDANRRLQDTNDGLRTIVDVNVVRSTAGSPRLGGRHEFTSLGSCGGAPPDILRSPSDNEIAERFYARAGGGRRRRRKKRDSNYFPGGSHSPSSGAGGDGSLYDSDSLRSRASCDSRIRISDLQFGMRRFMEDDPQEDSGVVEQFDEDGCMDSDVRDALDQLDSVTTVETTTISVPVGAEISPGETPRPVPKPRSIKKADLEQRDREITEVRHRADGVGITVDDHVKKNEESVQANEAPPPVPRRRNSKTISPLSTREISVRDLEPTGPPDRTYKVVFAGDAAVGKTSFINRLTKGHFVSNLASTLGVDFQVKTIRVDERNIAIQLWDTAGQERFRSVTRSYFRRADGVMLLYDVTSDRSFLSVRQWIEAVDDVAEKRIPIMLCANKVDLRLEACAAGRKCVSTDEGEKTARDHSAIFIETSAKEGKNVFDALVHLARDMCSSEDVEVQTSALKIRDDTNKKKCC